MSKIVFQIIDWFSLVQSVQQGVTGQSSSSTVAFEGLRIRMVEYSPGYMADHWCRNGHIVHCLEGEVTSEMESGESFLLTQGMSYVVSDDMSSHRSRSKNGVKLLIIDGDFLR